MNYSDLFHIAGVPEVDHKQGCEVLYFANEQIQGLIVDKFKVRLFKNNEIAKMMKWEDERLIDVRPDLFSWDIAPMLNITGHGDNVPWVTTLEGGRPAPGQWLNPDPNSDEYKNAVKANYWCEGEHPRSQKSRAAWYRRNAGEFMAYKNGLDIDLSKGVEVYKGETKTDIVKVLKCGDVWQLNYQKKVWGPIQMNYRYGFEISNVWSESQNIQAWYPIPNYTLKAPVTWSGLPKIG